MANFPETNILLNPLDDNNKKRLENVKTYLEVKAKPYHQNTSDPYKKEFHYFGGDYSVFINELLSKADIRIVASSGDRLTYTKKDIEKVLNETKL